jgi:Icc-related predicted phosphoesterase
LRIVAISDTHEKHKFPIPDGDVLVHAGDLTWQGDPAAIRRVGTWLRSLPHKHKIVIAGNHDRLFETHREIAEHQLGAGHRGLIYLQDSGVMLEGVAFWGSPWQPWFFDWAFNLRRGRAIAAKWSLIPDKTDVLVTHGPPMGILDAVGPEHVGCLDLLNRVTQLRPKVHIFGHIHEGSGELQRDGIQFVNASICDGQYVPANPARIIDF